MKGRITNILSFKKPLNKNNRSLKINNKFKKSSTTQYNYINKNTQYNNHNNNNNNMPNAINSINNNIFLNLFNRFNNTNSLRKKPFGAKQVISNRINNSHISKERKNLNMFEVPSSSSIKRKNNNLYDNPSLINSMNFIDNHGHINIRLNLKNQFINNSSNNYNNLTDVNSDIAEKMKEKDIKIIQLQNELLKSQEMINNLKNSKNNMDMNMNKCNYLNNSSQEKNLCILTKSSESVDKILQTAFNAYTSNITTNNNITKKKSTRKNYKNSFLKRCGNKKILECVKNSKTKEKQDRKQSERDNSKTNRNNIYSGYYKKKQSDYLRLFVPLSNYNNDKPKFNSYSNDKKNIKTKNKTNNINNLNNINVNMNKTEKNNNNVYLNKIEDDFYTTPKNEEFFIFASKCEELKKKTKILLDKYIDLGGILSKSSIK